MKINFAHPASVLVLSFLAVIILGTALLMLPLSHAGSEVAPLLTALFTATSAVCVTGLVLVDTGTYWSSAGQVIIMALFQLGGFGMMTSATLMGLLISGQMRLRTRLLLQAETHSLALGDVKSVAKLVLWVTLVMELAVAAALTLRFALSYGMPWDEAAWHGLFHAVSAFNNAGFSTWGDSVMRFVSDAFVLGPLMVAIIVGGLGFPVLHELMVERGSRRPQWSMHAVLTVWGSVALIVAGTLIIFLAEMNNTKTLAPLGWADKGLAALFTSVSARTAGFNAIDIGGLNTESLALHYTLMFIGGGSAGTAGGVKVTTFFVLVLVVWNEIRGHRDVEFRGRRIATSVQRQALTVLTLSAAMVSLAVLLILPLTPLPYEKVLFEVISAFGTVGLSTGITADLVPGAQAIIIALMFIGRVGVVTLAVALATNQMRRNYRYPEETPIVG
ncbi:potassium transporter TrkG [Polaromonas sp.]|uniref:TrkH family potassium uptake protein n=1 Tax=Polaromonas sp. TaxID=1869339 RepID=UPI003267D34D